MDARVLFYMIDGAFILASLIAVLWLGSDIWRDRGRRRTEARPVDKSKRMGSASEIEPWKTGLSPQEEELAAICWEMQEPYYPTTRTNGASSSGASKKPSASDGNTHGRS
jgi:hypothetical protein